MSFTGFYTEDNSGCVSSYASTMLTMFLFNFFYPVLDSCDFEKRTMCDWKNDLTNNVTRNKAYDWELHKGKTWSMHTGPTEDHTSANGKLPEMNPGWGDGL